MYQSIMVLFIGLSILLGQLEGFATETSIKTNPEKGPHGGEVVKSDGGTFEITVDQKKHLVDLYTLEAPYRKLPKEMKLKVNGSDEKKEIHLKSLNPWKGLPHFQGTLPSSGVPHPAGNSQKAFGIELGF